MNRAHERGLHRGLQRGEELGALHSSKRTADETAAAVFWQFAPIALCPTRPEPRGSLRARHGRSGASLRDDQPGRGRRRDLLLERQVPPSFWRPRAAIREADTDGNPATSADPSWEALFAPQTATTPPLATPAFPDHPSGHGCLSGAVLHTFAEFFGTDKVAVTIVSGRSLDGVPIAPRSFDRFSRVTKEIIDARVWGGIHFRTADVQGTVIGRRSPTGCGSTTSSPCAERSTGAGAACGGRPGSAPRSSAPAGDR